MPLLKSSQKKAILESAKNIIIIGLSPDTQKPSYKVAQYLLENGYNIIPIYPRGGEILGKKVFTSLKEALNHLAQNGEICDIVNIFRKSEALPEVMNEICEIKCNNTYGATFAPNLCVWVQLGLRNEKSHEIAQECGILYEEDSCIKIEHNKLFHT